MIQRSFDVKSESDLQKLADIKFYSEYASSKSVFVQLYVSRFSAEDAQKVANAVLQVIPQAKIVGMSLYGDPFVGLNVEKLLRFNFCFFEESDVTVLDYDGEKLPLEEIIADFRKKLSQTADAKGVLLLGSGITFKVSHFMEEITRGHKDIPFFGSVGNINTADVNDQAPYAFGNHVIRNGIVAVIFSGKNLHFYSESLFSWKPIGKEMRVEAGIPGAIGDSVIKTIDGLPATQIYKKYLDVDPDAHFISNICEFPIVVNRNGYLMPRVPCGFNEEGEINTMGDVRDGENIRFTYGKSTEILNKTEEASLRMRDFSPEAIFLFACANRAIFLKESAHKEIDFYTRFLRDLVYCHGFCELYSYNGQGGVFNSQLVTIGLREGEAMYCNLHRPIIPGIFFNKTPTKNLRSATYYPTTRVLVQKKKNPSDEEIWDSPTGEKSHTVVSELNKNELAQAQFAEQAQLWWTNEIMGMTNSSIKDEDSSFLRPLGVAIPIEERLVTFLEATTSELRNANQKANAANEAKSNFLSSMSHEIRTPINAVLGLDEMILRESSETPIKNYARDIQSSGRALLTIINDILDFSKIEAGKMEIIPADYDLRQTITDLCNMIQTRASAKGLTFIVDLDPTIPHLLNGDSVRIQQCALNILTNAVKYTPQGEVMLSVGAQKISDAEIELCFSVRDSGIGIKDDDLPKLFKPFERIEESRNRAIEGTGLGMSIVNGLLHQMDSELLVQSIYGKGSTFSFAVKQKVLDWEEIGNAEEIERALSKKATSYKESFQAPDAHILVVDDTPMNLTVIRGLLKRTRIQIDTAQSAKEGLKKAEENSYHIIFIDHLMPNMDGLEMLKILKAAKGIHCPPCVALTANAVSGARELYFSAGFEAYLSKPVDPKKLEETIAHFLPEQLLFHQGDSNFVEQNSTWDGVDRRKHSCGDAAGIFLELFDLDIEEALKNCGTKEVFREAVENFYEDIVKKSAQIENAVLKSDWKNFTILVHALKSSARLIGANGLSQKAKDLESAGDKAQTNNAEAIEKIKIQTPALISDYRSYAIKLLPFYKKNRLAQKIGLDEFKNALKALQEVVSIFDFDSADSIIEELDSCSIPDHYSDVYQKIRSAVKAVDYKAVLDALKTFNPLAKKNS